MPDVPLVSGAPPVGGLEGFVIGGACDEGVAAGGAFGGREAGVTGLPPGGFDAAGLDGFPEPAAGAPKMEPTTVGGGTWSGQVAGTVSG
jgi:hypothetical protein